MPQDKFGIEIQRGDVLAMVNTHKDYPAVLCVASEGFTPQFTRISHIYLWGYELFINVNKKRTRHLVVLSEEQIEGLINKIVQQRLMYQAEQVRNQQFVQFTEEEIREKLNELLELSREIKENN